eukprot:2188900-Rhodomonas_salina.1
MTGLASARLLCLHLLLTDYLSGNCKLTAPPPLCAQPQFPSSSSCQHAQSMGAGVKAGGGGLEAEGEGKGLWAVFPPLLLSPHPSLPLSL